MGAFELGPLLSGLVSGRPQLESQAGDLREQLMQLANTSVNPGVSVPNAPGAMDVFTHMLLSGAASAVSGNPAYLSGAQREHEAETERRAQAERLLQSTKIQDAFQRKQEITGVLQNELIQKYEGLKRIGAHEDAMDALVQAHKLEKERQKDHETFMAGQQAAEIKARHADSQAEIASRERISAADNAARLAMDPDASANPYQKAFLAQQRSMNQLTEAYLVSAKSAKGGQRKKIDDAYYNSQTQLLQAGAQTPWPGEDSTMWMKRAQDAGLAPQDILKLGKKHFPKEPWTIKKSGAARPIVVSPSASPEQAAFQSSTQMQAPDLMLILQMLQGGLSGGSTSPSGN